MVSFEVFLVRLMGVVVPSGMKCFFLVEAMLPVLESLVEMVDYMYLSAFRCSGKVRNVVSSNESGSIDAVSAPRGNGSERHVV